jgi:hypothetical protein
MSEAGYTVINKVSCRKPRDEKRFTNLRTAFGTHFPKLIVRKKLS